MNIAVEFDGTVVTYDHPRVGADVGAVPVLKKFVEEGHKIILSTTRYEENLRCAIDWFEKNNIPLYDATNLKIRADIHIDVRNLGCPIRNDENGMGSYVDWRKVAEEFGYDYDELCK